MMHVNINTKYKPVYSTPEVDLRDGLEGRGGGGTTTPRGERIGPGSCGRGVAASVRPAFVPRGG